MPRRKDPYVLKPKDDLNKVITAAKRNHQPFYIGVARKSGPRAVDAVRNRDKGGHHADQAVANTYGLQLDRVNHTRLLQEGNVCNLEAQLIKKHRNHPLCQNKKRGQNGCINADKGSAYVRTYTPRKASNTGRSKNKRTEKGKKKKSK